jgi:hypothetical protein
MNSAGLHMSKKIQLGWLNHASTDEFIEVTLSNVFKCPPASSMCHKPFSYPPIHEVLPFNLKIFRKDAEM